MKAVVFAGGVGTRLWPLSRKKTPKQFEKIVGEKSTLQLAVERLMPEFGWEEIYVATNLDYVDIVANQLPKLDRKHIFAEPAMRDLGPAVGQVIAALVQEDPDEPIAILWSDHLVREEELFRKVLKAAGGVVEENRDKIVFVAQRARFASENLGWIEFGEMVKRRDEVEFLQFVDFLYRPDSQTAKAYFEDSKHAWNLGYFVTTPRFLWEQYRKFAPNLYEPLSRLSKIWGSSDYLKLLEKEYPKMERISFDNAILEKLDARDAWVVNTDIGWSDIGAWEALKEALEASREGNVTMGKVNLTDTKDSLVYNYTDQLLVTIDLEGVLVVNTGDVTMVCKKESVPKIKKLVEGFVDGEHEKLI